MDEEKKEKRQQTTTSLLVIGLVLSALANILDVVPWVRIVIGVAAVGIIFWTFLRFTQEKHE